MTHQFLKLYEKHNDRYILVPPWKLGEVMQVIIRQRHESGDWYDDLFPEEEATESSDQFMKHDLELALAGDSTAALRFFRSRAKAEYEGWEVIALEEIL